MRGSDYAQLIAFMTVARERSFRAAAAQLQLSPSAVTKAIRELEERIGARLLDRTTRSVSTTEAGRALLDRLAPAFAEVDDASAAAREVSVGPSGRVRLNLPRLAFQLLLEPRLDEFAKTFPGVDLDLVIDDGLHDIVAAGCDAGIRVGGKIARDMVAVRLGPDIRPVVAGSPAYLATRTPPRDPADLEAHACLNYCWSETNVAFRWRFSEPAGAVFDVPVAGPLTANDTDVLVAAALAGRGLVYLPEERLRRHLAKGTLVEVLAGRCATSPPFFLYYADRRLQRSALRAVIDFLRV